MFGEVLEIIDISSPHFKPDLFLHQPSLTHCGLDLVHPGKANLPWKSPVTLGHPEVSEYNVKVSVWPQKDMDHTVNQDYFSLSTFHKCSQVCYFSEYHSAQNTATFVLLKTLLLF